MAPSIWQTKPWWCQPWSILLTGAGIVAGAWVGAGWLLPGLRLWLSAAALLAVAAWWGLFLVLVPRAWVMAQTQPHSQQSQAGPHSPAASASAEAQPPA